MPILIRTDASAAIGSGHVFRCLALADRLRILGRRPVFAARTMPPSLAARIAGAGFPLEILPPADGQNDNDAPHAHWLKSTWQADADACQTLAAAIDADIVVVDHYALGAGWEAAVAQGRRSVAVLDDLADRPHRSDLLVDPTLDETAALRYQDLTNDGCHHLFGPAFVILRDAFRTPVRRPAKATEAAAGLHWLVAFGGVDAARLTVRALDALVLASGPTDCATIVIGGENPARSSLEHMAHAHGWRVFVNAPEMAPLMAAADIAIGAGGLGLWERLATGLPSLAVIAADNQRTQVQGANAAGLAVGLDAAGLDDRTFADAAATLAIDAARRSAMAAHGQASVDGLGAERVAEAVAALRRRQR